MEIPNSPLVAPPRYSVVDIREELTTRPPRIRDFHSEDRCLASLAKEMAKNPRNMLQKLVEVAIEYCHADTAGISLLEVQDGKELFRWEALAGAFAHMRNNTMPRGASPCGVTIDENRTQLMYLAERAFPALKADPPFVEALLIPFHVNEIPIGTVWVVSHTPERGFDAEDERFLTALGQFASAAWRLWQAREEIEKINKGKDEFMAMISHELRTPLAVILNSTKLLSTTQLGPQETAKVIAAIERNANLQLRILNDLLHLSRLDAGKMEIQIALIDVTAVISAAIDMVAPYAEAKQTVISLQDGTIPQIRADADRLQQIVGNLLVNAVKFTPSNGAIDVAITADETNLLITVKDNGIGISPDFLPYVFDKFRQKDHAHLQGGLGLGLAIARALVEAHDGKITAQSDGEGYGCVFTVSLPLQAKPSGVPGALSLSAH